MRIRLFTFLLLLLAISYLPLATPAFAQFNSFSRPVLDLELEQTPYSSAATATGDIPSTGGDLFNVAPNEEEDNSYNCIASMSMNGKPVASNDFDLALTSSTGKTQKYTTGSFTLLPGEYRVAAHDKATGRKVASGTLANGAFTQNTSDKADDITIGEHTTIPKTTTTQSQREEDYIRTILGDPASSAKDATTRKDVPAITTSLPPVISPAMITKAITNAATTMLDTFLNFFR